MSSREAAPVASDEAIRGAEEGKEEALEFELRPAPLEPDRLPRPGELTIETDAVGSRIVFSLAGELDLESAPKLASRLDTVQLDDTRELVIDLEGVDFIDSTGLRVLLGAKRDAEDAGHRLLLRGAHGQVARLFEIAGVLEQFSFDDG
jgi:anti-sigma B factor antagonist